MARYQSQQSLALARQREIMRAARAAERARVVAERQAKLAHQQTQADSAATLNEDLAEYLAALEGILPQAADANYAVDFWSRKRGLEEFDAGGLDTAEAPPSLDQYTPPRPGAIARLLRMGTAEYERKLAGAPQLLEAAHAAHQVREEGRLTALSARREAFEAEVRGYNQHLDDLKAAFDRADPGAVSQYFSWVFQDIGALDLPLPTDEVEKAWPADDITQVAFVAESGQLVAEFDLPDMEAIPHWSSYRYIKSRDSIEPVQRSVRDIQSMYANLICQLTLRALRVIASADASGVTKTIVVNAFVDTTDRATGRAIHPCLITVRTTRETLLELNLASVDPTACLKGLNAQVSRSPHELAPVRPVVEFKMIDPRFVDSVDPTAGLRQRSNLMELSPKEFEELITTLFGKMGLETRMTRHSRDGGVDCVAWDMRPVVGGKVVVQAKRYKNPVGVSAVRDLLGTVQNEGAAKGILVTTSGFGKTAFDLTAKWPLQLVSGQELLYLLKEHMELDATIEMPEDWQDPVPDSDEETPVWAPKHGVDTENKEASPADPS